MACLGSLTKESLFFASEEEEVTLLEYFFFIFVFAMLSTSWRFGMESIAMDERSVETWQIQYWPVKALMFVGAVLILLAGVSRLIKDIRTYETCLKNEVGA